MNYLDKRIGPGASWLIRLGIYGTLTILVITAVLLHYKFS